MSRLVAEVCDAWEYQSTIGKKCKHILSSPAVVAYQWTKHGRPLRGEGDANLPLGLSDVSGPAHSVPGRRAIHTHTHAHKPRVSERHCSSQVIKLFRRELCNVIWSPSRYSIRIFDWIVSRVSVSVPSRESARMLDRGTKTQDAERRMPQRRYIIQFRDGPIYLFSREYPFSVKWKIPESKARPVFIVFIIDNKVIIMWKNQLSFINLYLHLL